MTVHTRFPKLRTYLLLLKEIIYLVTFFIRNQAISFSNSPTAISPKLANVHVLLSNINSGTSTLMLCQNHDRNSAAIMLSMP